MEDDSKGSFDNLQEAAVADKTAVQSVLSKTWLWISTIWQGAAKLVFTSIKLHLIKWSNSPEFPIVCWTIPGIAFCCVNKLRQLTEIW